jgi:predicted transposase/invertase (TIGR01784 family)
MTRRKTLKELTIKDNFMFGAVMCDENNCRRLLELVLEFPIERVEVSKEKSMIYHPEYKGVRLDVYAKDENHTHYNVEMQAVAHAALGKRARYYHSQMDMEFLLSGEDYDRLPKSYVIFVCDFDPFGKQKYCYTFENRCLEDQTLGLKDGSKSIFLSTKGKNEEEVPASLVNFLHFVSADLEESEADFQDEFVAELQKSVQHIKESREMEEHFMLFQELLKEERAEGREEGRAEVLKVMKDSILAIIGTKGSITEGLRERIVDEEDVQVLTAWIQLATKAESVEQFQKEI